MEDPHRQRQKRGRAHGPGTAGRTLVCALSQLAAHGDRPYLAETLVLWSMDVEHRERGQSWAFRRLTVASSLYCGERGESEAETEWRLSFKLPVEKKKKKLPVISLARICQWEVEGAARRAVGAQSPASLT